MPWECFFGGAGESRSEEERIDGGVVVVWPVGWVVIAGAAEAMGGCVACKAGGGGSVLGL